MKQMKYRLIRLAAALLLLCFVPQFVPDVSATYFTDVVRSELPDYFDAINYASDNGFMTGVTSAEFQPNACVTRATFISALYRYAGRPTSYTDIEFTDVPSSHWAYNAIRWSVRYQIVAGTTTTTFEPDTYITREQAMTFLFRYLVRYQGGTVYAPDSISGCGDYSSISSFAFQSVHWAVNNGIITPSGTAKRLYPLSVVYRKELALWLQRYGMRLDGIRFGKDNFSFINSLSNFQSTNAGRYLITNAQYAKLRNAATSEEWSNISTRVKTAPGGMCFGMSLSALLDKRGIIDFNRDFENNAAMLYNVRRPATSSPYHVVARDRLDNTEFTLAESAINFYHLSYELWDTLDYHEINMSTSGSQKLKPIVDALKTHGIILLVMQYCPTSSSSSLVGHAVVAYGTPKLDHNGENYLIRVYDPNKTTEQTYKISADYNSYEVLGDSQIYVKYFVYYASFYSIRSIDLDGESNIYSTSGMSESGEVGLLNDLSIDNTGGVSNPNDQRLAGQTWISLEATGSCSICNAEGKQLVCNAGMASGDMEILDHRIISNGMDTPSTVYFRIPYSDSFTYDCINGTTNISVLWEHRFQKLKGSGILHAEFTPERVSATGNTMTYELRLLTNSLDTLTIQGDEGTRFDVRNADENYNIECDVDYEVGLRSLYETDTTYFEKTLDAGEMCSICSSELHTLVTMNREGE